MEPSEPIERGSSRPPAPPLIEDCPQCGYDLTGLPSEHNCPECGLAYDNQTRVWRQRNAIGQWFAIGGIVLGVTATLLILRRYEPALFLSVSGLVILLLGLIRWRVAASSPFVMISGRGLSFRRRWRTKHFPWNEVSYVRRSGTAVVVKRSRSLTSARLPAVFAHALDAAQFVDAARMTQSRAATTPAGLSEALRPSDRTVS